MIILLIRILQFVFCSSDSIETILAALGVAPFKRRIMHGYKGRTDIIVSDNNSIYMRNYLPSKYKRNNGSWFFFHSFLTLMFSAISLCS